MTNLHLDVASRGQGRAWAAFEALAPSPAEAGRLGRSLAILRAVDTLLAQDDATLAQTLAAAEALRPGVTRTLVAAFEAEAVHLTGLAHRLWAAADRLSSTKEG